MFITTQGYLGMEHEGIQESGLVSVFHGGEVPFLLRADDQKDNKVSKVVSATFTA